MIDIHILESIKDAQFEHGLKYENFQRYASYCSRRLHRLRRSLNVHQKIAPTAKARHQRARKLTDISNAMVLEAGEYGERMILIQLYLAERAWAHYMLLKQQAPEAPRKRFHMMKRLKKASKYADLFENLCHDPDSPCSDRMKKEVIAYVAYIKGSYSMECRDWEAARDFFNKSLQIYFVMSMQILNEQVKEKYAQQIDGLRANLKYCLFNLGQIDPPRRRLQFNDIAGRHVIAILEQQAKEQHQPSKEQPQHSKEQQQIKLDQQQQQQKQEPSKEQGGSSEEEENSSDEYDEAEETQEGLINKLYSLKNKLPGLW